MDQYATTVAADSIGVDAAAVGQLGQSIECGIDHPRTGVPVDLGNQAKAAAVVFKSGIVQGREIWLRHRALPAGREDVSPANRDSLEGILHATRVTTRAHLLCCVKTIWTAIRQNHVHHQATGRA
jgi:hypothetical protein